MHKNGHNVFYQDNLCIFRCLTWAQEEGRGANFENTVHAHYAQWADYLIQQGQTNIPLNGKKYEGIILEDLPDFEECFNICVSVYSLDQDNTCTRVYISSLELDREVQRELFLNLYDSHFSLITKFQTYASKYGCRSCGRGFAHLNKLKIHKSSHTPDEYIFHPRVSLRKWMSLWEYGLTNHYSFTPGFAFLILNRC